MDTSQWVKVMTAQEIDDFYALTASLDPTFAQRQRAFYEGRTLDQLNAHAAQAWNCCDPTGYMLARSHAAAKGGALK